MKDTAAVSERTSIRITMFAIAVLGGIILAIKFSAHPVAWILVLMVSVPVFAALTGYLPQKNESDRS